MVASAPARHHMNCRTFPPDTASTGVSEPGRTPGGMASEGRGHQLEAPSTPRQESSSQEQSKAAAPSCSASCKWRPHDRQFFTSTTLRRSGSLIIAVDGEGFFADRASARQPSDRSHGHHLKNQIMCPLRHKIWKRYPPGIFSCIFSSRSRSVAGRSWILDLLR